MLSRLSSHALDAQVDVARRRIRTVLETFPGRVALSVSFGGASGMALLDLAVGIDPALAVFVVDTELLFPETYALIERAEARYGISVQPVTPRASVTEQAVQHGDALWTRDPDACCAIRKVEPLRRFLADYDAWMTAVRRDQSATRESISVSAWNAGAQVVKVAPLVDWTAADVQAYVAAFDVPVNTLLYEGYRSIGCTHCTLRTAPGGDERAGRWAGFTKTECGIHAG